MPTDLSPRPESPLARRPSRQETLERRGQGSLDVFEERFFSPYGATWTARSLTLPDGMEFDSWESLVGAMLQQNERLIFHIADALDYGERRYGVSFTQAVEMAGVSERVLGRIRSLQRVPARNRSESLSADHHLAVASLDPKAQGVLLGHAIDRKLSVEAVQLAADGLRAAVADSRPQAALVPTQNVVVGDVRVRMTWQAWAEAGIKHLSRENLARGTVYADNFIRSYGTGEMHMDPDVPTEAVYGGGAPGGEPCTALVPVGLVPVGSPPLGGAAGGEAEEEAEALPPRVRVRAYLELAGRATNPQMAEALGIAKRTVDGATKALAEEGVIARTGEHDDTSTSPTPPPYWALAGRAGEGESGDDVLEGVYRDADGDQAGGGQTECPT